MWSTAAWPSFLLYYRPVVFFLHLCLIAFSFPQGTVDAFKKCYSFFLLPKNCVTWNCVSRGGVCLETRSKRLACVCRISWYGWFWFLYPRFFSINVNWPSGGEEGRKFCSDMTAWWPQSFMRDNNSVVVSYGQSSHPGHNVPYYTLTVYPIHEHEHTTSTQFSKMCHVSVKRVAVLVCIGRYRLQISPWRPSTLRLLVLFSLFD
jgi:hypothetical protein